MSDPTTAQDFLDAVTEVLDSLGSTKSVRVIAYAALDANNPGAGRTQTPTDYSVEAIIYDYDDKYVDGSTIQQGDRAAVLSIDPLDSSVVELIKPNAKLVDGSTIYAIVDVKATEIAGEKVALFLQLRG